MFLAYIQRLLLPSKHGRHLFHLVRVVRLQLTASRTQIAHSKQLNYTRIYQVGLVPVANQTYLYLGRCFVLNYPLNLYSENNILTEPSPYLIIPSYLLGHKEDRGCALRSYLKTSLPQVFTIYLDGSDYPHLSAFIQQVLSIKVFSCFVLAYSEMHTSVIVKFLLHHDKMAYWFFQSLL